MKNIIKESIEIKAPITRVWKALTDCQEFGAWFGVKLITPFLEGQASQGQLTYPGYEHHKMKIIVQRIEQESIFSFTWHPYAVEENIDYSTETPTLIEFSLKKSENDTLLSVTESGFENLPEDRRDKAFQMNSNGWAQQMQNIKNFVEKAGKV